MVILFAIYILVDVLLYIFGRWHLLGGGAQGVKRKWRGNVSRANFVEPAE
jgi:hypothetical protein